MSNSFVWPIDRTLSGSTILGQSRPQSHGNEVALHIFQRSSITRASPSDCFVSYPGHSLGEFCPFAEMQSVHSHSTAPLHIFQRSGITRASLSDCLVSHQDTRWGSFTPLQRCSLYILLPHPIGLGVVG